MTCSDGAERAGVGVLLAASTSAGSVTSDELLVFTYPVISSSLPRPLLYHDHLLSTPVHTGFWASEPTSRPNEVTR